MDPADLRVFEAVARFGSMGRAAAHLNTVQSNVTAHIQDLEHQLGVTLFTRHSRGVALTAAGTRLLPYVSRLTALLEDARRAAVDDGTPRGPLLLGTLETTAAIHLAPVLTRFVATYPGVDLTLRAGTTDELLGKVLGEEIEAAFVCGPVVHPELEANAVWQEELVLLSTPSVDSLDELLDPGMGCRIVVLRAGCSYRLRLKDLLARRGVPVARTLEFGTLEALFACVGAGLGVTLLPRSLIGRGLRAGLLKTHTLARSESRVETVLIRRRDAHRSSAMRAFISMLDTSENGLQQAAAD
jgi:LysR family transcriptional regulator, cell division regulator